MRILIITNYLPYPLISGDRIRIYNLIKQVAQKHEVWVAGFLQSPEEEQYIPHFLEFCKGVAVVPFKQHSPLEHIPGLVKFALEGKPLENKFKHSPELVEKIRQLDREHHFDIIQIEHSHMALYKEAIPPESRAKTILVLINLASLQYARIAENERRFVRKVRAHIYSRQMKTWEPKYAERFDKCITMSEVDRQMLLKINPRLSNAESVPNGVDTRQYHPLPKTQGKPAILFIGTMNYPPCVDAVLYFTKEVLPLIWKEMPEVEYWVVGRQPTEEIQALASDKIHITGRVEEIVPYYERTMVSTVPLRSGGGTRLKILESMALGRPVVCTSIGGEGIDMVDGKHAMIADDPKTFAEKTLRLLRDPQLYDELTQNGRQLVVDQYDWVSLGDKMLRIYDELAQPQTTP